MNGGAISKLLDMHGMLDAHGPAGGFPCPEDVFLNWALSLPMDADIAEAAQKEITRIDASEQSSDSACRLRELLVEATAFDPNRPFGGPGHC